MKLVLDASITLGWCFQDERDAAAMQVMGTVVEGGALVPAVWRLEIANAMVVGMRRHRMTITDRDDLMTALDEMNITVDPQSHTHVWPAAMDLASLHGLALYDATYLELALRHRLPLATSDNRLRRAVTAVGLPVLPA